MRRRLLTIGSVVEMCSYTFYKKFLLREAKKISFCHAFVIDSNKT